MQGKARVQMPNRAQLELRASDLESLLPEGHRARLVWGYVERQDLTAFYETIQVVEGGVGRSATAPEILLALWLCATLDGVGSARAIARLTETHDAYRWLCGGVQVNYHTLSDFRKDHGPALDELLSVNIAGLLAAGVVKLKHVAQDGMRVRAGAGAASFRRKASLEDCLTAARAEVARLKDEVDQDAGGSERRQSAARERAARERQARVEAALARLPELAAIKARQGKKAEEARASTTDPEATVMKMGDGGFRPAYNPQLATDTDSQVIVGVEIIACGSDQGQMNPMIEQVKARCGQTPQAWLVDGGFAGHDEVTQASQRTVIYAPVMKSKGQATDPHQPKPTDSPEVGQWRVRMATEQAKAIYKLRAQTAECVNAQCRNRGLQQFRVRGLAKVKCVLLLHALAHNLMRMAALIPDWLGVGTSTPAVAKMPG